MKPSHKLLPQTFNVIKINLIDEILFSRFIHKKKKFVSSLTLYLFSILFLEFRQCSHFTVHVFLCLSHFDIHASSSLDRGSQEGTRALSGIYSL